MKKIFSFVVMAALVLGMASCGNEPAFIPVETQEGTFENGTWYYNADNQTLEVTANGDIKRPYAWNEENFRKSIKHLKLFGSIKTIDEYAFNNCINLEDVTGSFVTPGYHSFANCESLKSIVISDEATYVGRSAFDGCVSLRTVTIGNKVNTIGSSAFHGSGLKSLYIPASVAKIEEYAFYGCYALGEIEVGRTTPPALGKNALDLNFLKSVIVPKGSKGAYKEAEGWKDCIIIEKQ